jgi:nucleoside-diphosphate-sugar epimerase
MSNILIIGCGDLGGTVAKLLSDSGHVITGVRASNKPLPAKINLIQADVTQISSLIALAQIHADILIYCVAATAQTDENYRMHYVEGLRNILTTQVNNSHLKHVFFVSSTRVYGQETDILLDELTIPAPSDFGGARLLEAEQLLTSLACNSTVIRLSGIYGSNRQYLVNMAKEPKLWPQDHKWTNRIHRDDAARFICFLCQQVLIGKVVEDCYIGVDDLPTLQYDVLTWIASRLNIAPPQINFTGKVTGKRLSNRRMRETGFVLKYANYQVGYSEILKHV